jgi:3-deoxy-D-manno-octulosonic-acid transferase
VTPPALWLYRIAVAAALPVAAPLLLAVARRRGTERPPVAERLALSLPPLPRGGVWMQAVSVGEVTVARPLLAELRRRHAELPLVLSATTATGLRLARAYGVADSVITFPLDLPGPVRRSLDAARPRLVVLVETEIWPEFLSACARRAIPVVLVNARVSERSFRRYRLARPLLAPVLRAVSLALAQDDLDAERLAAIGVRPERLRVTGNLKFDVAPPAPPPQVGAELRRLAGARPVWIAGSTVAGEEERVMGAWSLMPPARRPFLIVAPRHPERSEDAIAAARRHDARVVRRTALSGHAASCDVVVLDTIGELAALYELADVAFVGGSLLPTGGHNPIEPARHGVPVLTGPHISNFLTIYEHFIECGAARVVRDETSLAEAVMELTGDTDAARVAGAAGRALLDRNAGATQRTADALEPFLA